VRRRDLLTAAATTFVAGVAPRLGFGADRAKTLIFTGVADLSVLDPVVTGARPTRNSAYLVFDTLYGLDTNWQAQPQMVEGHEVSADKLSWTLKLREGLRFHDKEPVLAKDVVTSIRRFAPRVIFASALMAVTDELSAPDDRTVRFRLKRPFPHLPEALAGPGGNVPAIMPERLAAESPFKPVAEIVGSGPFRYLKDEHVSGARVVFERFAEYRPRAAEGPAGARGFTSGPKVAHFDRVEWLTLDPFSASAALKRGEIDWWENPARDLVGQVSGDLNITVVSHFATANGIMTFNQLHPPFDNPAIRRALLGAVDQAEAISTIDECPSVRQSGDPRRRQGADQRLGQQPEDRGVAHCLARHRGSGRAEADLRRIAEAAVTGRAVHPARRILAGLGLPQGSGRCHSRLLRDLLRRAAGVTS
jgi:peptide/nickel transport system substrate-binding protein